MPWLMGRCPLFDLQELLNGACAAGIRQAELAAASSGDNPAVSRAQDGIPGLICTPFAIWSVFRLWATSTTDPPGVKSFSQADCSTVRGLRSAGPAGPRPTMRNKASFCCNCGAW